MEESPLGKMNVLIYGGKAAGAREYALVNMAIRSPMTDQVFSVGSNAGLTQLDGCECQEQPDSHDEVVTICRDLKIDLVIVGPEAPLATGLADTLRAADIATFGPNQVAAQLETSKEWAVDFMGRNNVPTAKTFTFNSQTTAEECLSQVVCWPVVVKYSGLAGGKGVDICHNWEQGLTALKRHYDKEPQATVLIQEFLPDNPAMKRSEISVHVVVSGSTYKILPTAQDYKPRFDGDKGDMTGGMGANGPTTDVDMERIENEIIKPTVDGLVAEGISYNGVIYFGLKVCPEGPKVVEYNVRFGDPEMVIIDMLVTSDLLPLLCAAAKGEDVSGMEVECFDGHACGVVIVNKAYPGKGKACALPPHLQQPGFYHAATRLENKVVVADGGRIGVLGFRRGTPEAAGSAVYDVIAQGDLGELACRSDISA